MRCMPAKKILVRHILNKERPMKTSPFLALIFLTLPGCMSFSYDLTVPGANQAPASPRIGRDCGIVLFGLGYGDLSVAEAMTRGHITKPTKIGISESYILLAGQNCVNVEGEGDPSAPAIPAPDTTGPGYEYRQRK